MWIGFAFFDPVTAPHQHRKGLRPPNAGLGSFGRRWCRDGVVSAGRLGRLRYSFAHPYWVRGNEFIITPNYNAKVLRINRIVNIDLTPYDDRLPQVQDILQVLRPDHEISTKGTSIGIAKFALELKTLTLIMFSNLYPLSNTSFFNLGRAQFLCDLITEVPIDICAHIFQTIGKTAARMAAQTCLPFCSLLMKIMDLEGVHPPKDRKLLVHLRRISMVSLQVSKSHSSKALRSESLPHATPSSHGLAIHTTPRHTETISPHTPKLQMTSTQHVQSSSQVDRLSILIKGLHQHISGFENVLYSTNNQVQMHLTAIETQLDAIQCKLEESL